MTVCAYLRNVCISRVIKNVTVCYNCGMYRLICDDFMNWCVF